MMISVCKSKIHRATVTDKNLNYVGSITIDSDLIKRADLVPWEKVQVININTGERFDTYVIEGKPKSGVIALNGGAARKGEIGDLLIIVAYGLIDKNEAAGFKPAIVHVDKKNKPSKN
jgi:aspartate 1-decarboxylase